MASPWTPEEATLLRRRAVRTKLRRFLHKQSLGIEDLAKSTGLDSIWLHELLAPDSRSPLTDPRFEPLAKALGTPILELQRYEIFIAWDMTMRGVVHTLSRLVRISEETAAPVRVTVALPQIGAGEIWRSLTQPAIARADRVIALIDEDNANVGYEIGYAVGLGVPVHLLLGDPNAQTFAQLSPLNGFARSQATRPTDGLNISDFHRAIVSIDEYVHSPKRPGGGRIIGLLVPNAGDGVALSQTILEERPSWRPLETKGPESDWSLLDIDRRVADCGFLVWIILPSLGKRDGRHNAANAVVAGYAQAIGLPSKILLDEEARLPLDVAVTAQGWKGELEIRSHIAGLPDLLPAAVTKNAPVLDDSPQALIQAWKRKTRQLLEQFVGRALNVSMFHVLPLQLVDTGSPEELTKRIRRGTSDETSVAAVDRTLDLFKGLASTTGDATDRRWVVVGDPGSGKSTLLRHIAWTQAGSPDAPIAVLWHASKFAALDPDDDTRDLFALIAKTFAPDHDARARALAGALRECARQPNGFWLLLDGWDEVGTAASKVLANLNAWLDSGAGRNTSVAITTRRTGFDSTLFSRRFRGAALAGLLPTEQHQLLANFLGVSRGREAFETLANRPALSEIVRSPLVLRLVARLCEAGQEIPHRRRELYAASILCLLSRGHTANAADIEIPTEIPGVRDVRAALHLLPGLAYELLLQKCHATEEQPQTQLDFRQALEKTLLLTSDSWLRAWGNKSDAFLDDIATQSGLFGPLLYSEDPWSFLHKTFQEYLASEWLRPKTATDRRWESALHDIVALPGAAVFAEVFAFVAASLPPTDAGSLLNTLREKQTDVFWRALPEVESLSIQRGLDLFFSAEDRDGDRLFASMKGWGRGISYETIEADVHEWMNRHRHAGGSLSLDDFAYLLYALEALQLHCHRITDTSTTLTDQNALAERFFAVAGGRFTGKRPTISRVRIPPGDADSCSFRRHPTIPGSDGHAPDTTLTWFEMGETPVTFAEFQALDPAGSGSKAAKPRFPATEISWWEAWLFARWVGGDLPTEAQWEVACRAGTTTEWWCGDTEAEIQRFEWHQRQRKNKPWPVGECRSDRHPWQLQDMTGLVLQWCKDWYGDYPAGAQSNPGGPSHGSVRVLRGGSFRSGASWARSACRIRSGPWWRNDVSIGFRVCFPRALSSTFDP